MDIDFGNLLGIAGDASGTINNALSAFAELSKLAKADKLPLDAAGDMLTLSTELGEAKVKLGFLETEIVKLQRALEALDEIKQRKRNYMLTETPMGERVYRLKPDADTGEPPHDVCPDCFQRDQIVILQPRGEMLKCTACKESYRFREITRPRRTRSS